ncbi:hypothetical protein Aca07nite_11330 [Actinoplanes capillaceus]|uniref:Secreted protein n=1 Tax=Actinoplanes campanulatus TaxID=113559 RepID=A0ABQ3WEJ4_9ACTN|nr:hypothetical protein [Actinoplanes capillaceus]GID43858.1 hypothetical protein Aca07nite_11330 [Actinoplanes capillaceus]
MPIIRSLAPLLLLTGCAARTPEPEPEPAQTAPCPAVIDHVAEPPAGYRVVGENIALPDEDTVHRPNESGQEGPARLFAKFGLLVRAGTTTELSLPPEWSERARIGWGQQEPAMSQTVTGCPPGWGDGAWSVFAGGVSVIEPDCVPIRVGPDAIAEVSIGTPCSRPGG